ncbi:MFS transporter [Streptomyces sp. NPDC048172]|uniref:MFS transporter n=1 Tax=Streptomyces sp. NPDC048172 TaxID=3365505 RepID=UPI00371A26C0
MGAEEDPGAVEVTLEIPDYVLPLPAQRGPDEPGEPEAAEGDDAEPPLGGEALPVRPAVGQTALAPVEDAEVSGGAEGSAGPGPGVWRRMTALLGVTLAVAVTALEQTVIAAALPQLTGELGGADRTFWILVLPLVAMAFGPLLFGWLGDRCGHTGSFGLALAVFTAGSAVAGWCGAVPELIAFRIVQGVAAGGVLAEARWVASGTGPARTRTRRLGFLLVVLGLAAAAGPGLGGWLTEAHGWRWCLWLALPAGLLGLALGAFAVDTGARTRSPRSPRAPGSALAALPRPRALLLCAVLAVAAVGAADALPHYLWLVDAATGDEGATRAGLLLAPLLGGVLAAALLAGELIARTGHFRTFPVIGCAMGVEGMWLLAQVEADTSEAVFGVWTAILGLGIGFTLPVLVRAAGGALGATGPYAGAQRDWVRRTAGALGAALVAVLLLHRLAVALAPGTDGLPDALRDMYADTYADAMPRAFLSLLPMLLLGLLLALFLKENSLVTQHISVPQARASEPVTATVGTVGAPTSAGVPVCGSVRHHDGSSVPHAALTLVDTAGRQVGRGATGEDGRYALSTPGEGAYVMIASAGGHQPRAVSVSVGERPVELDVVLGGAGRLAGSVLTADGQPVKDAAVTLTDVRGEVVATTHSGREGTYVIGDLVAGEYTLAASAPVYRPAALPVSVQASRETRQDIELAGGAVLRGTVRAGGGRPVEEARVTLLDAAGNVVDTVTTGADGAFRFVDLSSGEYTVVAAGYPPVATVLQIAGGGRTERDLQLGHED